MKDMYFNLIMLLERLHRLFLEVLRAELDRLKIRDVNNVQSMILYNIGKGQMSVGEIGNRGYYLGSNVSYNLKKMIENGYIVQEASLHDRRSIQIKLSTKGMRLYENLDKAIGQQIDNLKNHSITLEDLDLVTSKARDLESYWSILLSKDLRLIK